MEISVKAVASGRIAAKQQQKFPTEQGTLEDCVKKYRISYKITFENDFSVEIETLLKDHSLNKETHLLGLTYAMTCFSIVRKN